MNQYKLSMKRNLFAILILFIGFYSFGQKQIEGDNKLKVASNNGIEVFYEIEVDAAENQLLNIRFVNTSEEDQTIGWTLVTPGKMVFNSVESFTIQAGTDYLQKHILELKKSMDIGEYNFNLITNSK